MARTVPHELSTHPDSLYTPHEAARLLRTNARTIERWRTRGNGPIFTKIGRRVAYRLGDLTDWIAAHRQQHTTELPQGRARGRRR